MLRSAKIAPVFEYALLERFWSDADELGFHAVWNYDHFYGLYLAGQPLELPTLEGWTTLGAMAKVTERARIGCMVTGVTYRHPALLANMAVAVDHISGGRLEFGIGAAWHEPEHLTYGMDFPSAGTRIAMLDEACEIIRRLWTEEKVDHDGRFWKLRDALCEPKPIQAKVPMVIGGSGPRKTLRVVAKHADEWNAPAATADDYRRLASILEEHCADVGRNPEEIRRSVQLFVFSSDDDTIADLPRQIAELEDAGVQHVVLSFYSPPTRDVLAKLAPD
ncbi:MAG: TIGR03560 family F420-dependent LLM class oxidoreductase [Actinomycetota bacterium]